MSVWGLWVLSMCLAVQDGSYYPTCCATVEDAPATSQADEDAEEKPGDWNVDEPPLPMKPVSIDTDEGTWMNVDVSPDGKSIVFDLLGDLYVIPITGGDAKPLTSGLAWDMQPAFSPDGKRITFTSDRGGGDNIWVMNHDGSEPTAVTKEKFRLLNSPTWTSDSEYIAARKHFTSRRSLGAGEIWLYHRSGGEGLQMTKRPNDQKDLGEPAFSPDGQFLYYSQDTTPGKVFEYSKDPNSGIYSINRVHLETRETRRLVSGPGGAIRPTPSPDGKTLAFVRRVRYQSVLFLRDLASGAERPLYHDLERDMQETWAVHGVYPTMAWTPDSKSIVFYARGKIRRVEIADGQSRVIPFRVRVTKQIADAVRYPVAVSADRFRVRVLRWSQVSPSGDAIVYQALGHLYRRDLPDGQPQRLTEQKDHFEFYPSFSRDGKWIVYTTWNDDALGTVRVVAAGGGEGRVVTDRPGHYIEPVFSPNGRTIVYRRIGGGGLRSRTWADDTGIFMRPAAGGPAKRITRSGTSPQFGAANDRLYIMRNKREEKEDKRQLVSLDLDGSDERVEAVSKNATAYRVSPDGRWLAFTERFNAYLAAFPRTGKPINLGPKTKSIPVQKVSRDAGEFVHFSGDGGTLHWTLGGNLYSRDLKDAFAFLEGAPEELPEPPAEGRDVSFEGVTDVPTGKVALTGGRVITMRGDEVIENGTVLVEGNRITLVGPTAAVTVPAEAHVIDVTGKTLIPGLVDVHDHGPHGGSGIIPQRNWSLHAKLAFGVTTVHDPSHDTNTIFASSELSKAGLILAPRIFSTGTILYGAAGHFKAEIDSLEDAQSHLRRMHAVGAISVKSYNQPRRDQRQQVLVAARELDMMVVPEGGSLLQHNLTMIVDGHTGIEHAIPVERAYQDVIALWAATQVGYTPTLTVAYGGMSGEHYWYQVSNVWENEHLLGFMPRDRLDARSRRRRKVPENELNHISCAQVCKKLVDAGVKVNLGAHGQLAGLAHHWELWMFAQGGMTPLEVIRAGTLDPAHYVGLDGDIGSIEPGKLADLIVLDGNPLADIKNTVKVRYTMLNGRIYESKTLNQIGNHPKKRGRYYWEPMN